MKPLNMDNIIDYEKDFHMIRGVFGYFNFKIKLILSVFIDLFLMGSMIVVISNMFEHLVMDCCKRTRNNQIVVSITILSKFCSLNIVYILEQFLTSN